MKGINYRSKGATDDAFVHFIIALDLLFGEKDASNQAISKRAAMLTHQALGISYHEMLQQIKKLYDIRSKFVHEGRKVPESDLASAQPIMQEIFTSLMRIQSKTEYKTDGAMTLWLKGIDYLCAAIDASKPISDDEFEALGISKSRSPLERFRHA
jgi:hypothetical protein